MPKPTAEMTETNVWLPVTPPLSVAFAQMSASEEANGIRLTLDFADDHSGAAVSIWRSASPEFATRAALTSQDIAVSGRAFSYLDATAESGVTYFYWIQVRETSGAVVWNGPVSGQLAGHLTFAAPPAPNPVRASTRFAYSIGADAARSGPVEVSLRLRDVQGRMIRNLASARQGVGQYSVKWNVDDDHGRHVAPGIYYLQLSAGSRQHTVRVAVVN
jgi:flagellar hook capping protein FlgD